MKASGTSSAGGEECLRPGADPRLRTLLDWLRQRKFIITAEDHRRLAAAFPPERALPRAQVRAALTALLAKNRDQRRTLGRLFDQLFPPPAEGIDPLLAVRRTGKGPAKAPIVASRKRPGTPTQAQPRRAWWTRRNALFLAGTGLILVLATALVLAALRGYWSQPESRPEPVPSVEKGDTPRPAADPRELPAQPVAHFHAWVPVLELDAAGALDRLGPPLALFLAAGLGLAWLGQRMRDRTRLDFAIPPLVAQGPDDFHWPRPLGDQPLLLDGQARREMVWGTTQRAAWPCACWTGAAPIWP